MIKDCNTEKMKEFLESMLRDLNSKKMATTSKELVAEKSEAILKCVHDGKFN